MYKEDDAAGTAVKHGRSCGAVFLDAAGTLLRVEPSVGAVYAREAARFGVIADAESLNRAFTAAWRARQQQDPTGAEFYSSEETEKAWWRELVAEVFQSTGKWVGFSGNFAEYFEGLFELFARPEVWHVFEDVVPALEALGTAGIPCAVVSNWDSRLPLLMDRLNLSLHFRFILTSAEAGCRKPAPGIFHHALSRFGLPANRVVYVGDSIEEDVIGAENAGLIPVYLDRSGRSAPDGVAIRDLRELAALLA